VLPAGLRLSIAASATEEVVDVVVENGATADLEATEPRVALPRSAAPPDDPTTPGETLPPASVSPDRADDATTTVAHQLEHRADSTTVVEAQPERTDDSTTLVLPLTEGAAPGGLDRDDIARFYRDFGGPGQQL